MIKIQGNVATAVWTESARSKGCNNPKLQIPTCALAASARQQVDQRQCLCGHLAGIRYISDVSRIRELTSNASLALFVRPGGRMWPDVARQQFARLCCQESVPMPEAAIPYDARG